jgi:hypothetical protein
LLFRLEFEVKYLNGETATVLTRPATDIAFERKYGVSVGSLLTETLPDEENRHSMLKWYSELKAEHSCFLAWHACGSRLPFDDWVETIDEVTWEFAKTVDPTRPVQPATTSALSLPSRESRRKNSPTARTKTSSP